ncbi:MAG: hypothetical protein Q8L88_02455 [Bacteroidota bacterium]|nr:hypothetical protein [Bacteroidota bacterium]
MAYEQEQALAQVMFEQDRKNAKEISTQLAVPLATVYRWIKSGKWQQYKIDLVMNKFDAFKNFQELVSKKMDEIMSKPGIDKTDLDLLKGMMKTASDMGKDIDRRGTILLGHKEFVKFMRDEHPEKIGEFIPYFSEFPKWINKQYPEA